MKIKEKQKLLFSQFPKTQKVEINGAEREIPELTEENFWTLIQDYNELVKTFNENVKKINKFISKK